jgi:hypothetical protein
MQTTICLSIAAFGQSWMLENALMRDNTQKARYMETYDDKKLSRFALYI